MSGLQSWNLFAEFSIILFNNKGFFETEILIASASTEEKKLEYAQMKVKRFKEIESISFCEIKNFVCRELEVPQA